MPESRNRCEWNRMGDVGADYFHRGKPRVKKSQRGHAQCAGPHRRNSHQYSEQQTGGNGGLIETSGQRVLQVAGGRVDASATNGISGTWLLDPRNVEIKDAATSGGAFNNLNPDVFTPSADNAVVGRNDIQNALNLGTSVTIRTAGGGTQDGDTFHGHRVTERRAGGKLTGR